MCGIIFATFLLDYELIAAALAAIAAIWAMLCGRLRRTQGLALFFIIGICACAISRSAPVSFGNQSVAQQYDGRVIDSRFSPFNQRLIVEANTGRGLSRILLHYHTDGEAVEVGDKVRFQCALRPVDEGFKAPGEYRAEDLARRWNVNAEAHISDGELTIVQRNSGLSGFMAHQRDRFSNFIRYRTGLSDDAATILTTVLTGSTDLLGQDIRREFAASGTSHVLALSGLHVGILVMILAAILFPLRLLRKQWLYQSVLLAAVWGYIIFAGCLPSITRTGIMITAAALGHLLGRRNAALNALALAAIAILIAAPHTLFSPGFQLSFLAVAAILMFAFIPIQWMNDHHLNRFRYLFEWLGVSLAAVIGTAPLAACYFHQLPVAFLLSNLLFAIGLPVFIALGLLLLLLAWANLAPLWMAEAENQVCQLLVGFNRWVASQPWTHLDGVYFHLWALLPYYAALIVFWVAYRQRSKALVFPAFTLLIASAALATIPKGLGQSVEAKDLPPQTEVYALHDIYATTLLVRHGDHAWLVSDGNPKFAASLSSRMQSRLRTFMDINHIDSLRPASCLRIGNHIDLSPHSWRILSRKVILHSGRLTYADTIALTGAAQSATPSARPILLITRGFKARQAPSLAAFLRHSFSISGRQSKATGDSFSRLHPGAADTPSERKSVESDTLPPLPDIILSPAIHPDTREKIATALSSASIPFSTALEGPLP